MQKTTLHAEHRRLNAKMTDFHGWDMPLYYTSILEEHQAVRATAGIFDISHMGQARLSGEGALETLNELVISDVASVGEGRACYTMFLNEQGGILDDVIIYRLGRQDYLVIINCANRASDVAWMQAHQRGAVEIRDISEGRAILAIQGPIAAQLLEDILAFPVKALGRFDVVAIPSLGSMAWVARTGYTGSDGFEFFVPDAVAHRLWQQVLERGASCGIVPIGLGARDTLRLEAGLRLYGTDMDTTTTPFEADLGWTVAIHKPSFLGKASLVAQNTRGLSRRLVGFELVEGPIPRQGFSLFAQGRQVGAVTSGTFSPTLNKAIGMGYVELPFAPPSTMLQIMIRGKTYPVTVVKMPFWKAEALKHACTK
ncbi:MAG: glycine cleavage system aminomethyltransferase GcvT [Candidatus Omnitrophica bacterium]|nr:glycine cleavage system aminomethyltransferase GcvT [Candidatus Omnitrophota bacterium]